MYLLISTITICITILVITFFAILPYLKEKNKIRDKEAKNDLYKIYTSVDPDLIQANLNNLVDEKLREYILVNISTRESIYMNATDIDTMIKTVSANIYINLSEMYLAYIRLVNIINSDDELIVYINNIVKIRSIPMITENNKLI